VRIGVSVLTLLSHELGDGDNLLPAQP